MEGTLQLTGTFRIDGNVKGNIISEQTVVLGEGAKVNLLGYGPAAGKFVKVNDAWLVEVARKNKGRLVTLDTHLSAHATEDDQVETIIS
jgi:hypothetical protein